MSENVLLLAIKSATRTLEKEFHEIDEKCKKNPNDGSLKEMRHKILKDGETLQRLENNVRKNNRLDSQDSKGWDRLQKLYLKKFPF